MSEHILVDTCGWIEYATDGPLADTFAPYFRDLTRLVVPTVIQFELFNWGCRERDEAIALELIGLTEHGVVVPLTTPIALLAADLSSQHRLAMAAATKGKTTTIPAKGGRLEPLVGLRVQLPRGCDRRGQSRTSPA